MSAEAIRTPVAGAIFWAEAAPDGSGSPRGIAGPPPALKVTVSIQDPAKPPQGIVAKITPRGCALVAPPVLVPPPPNPPPPSLDAAWRDVEQEGLPTLTPVRVTGQVESLDGRYFPRLFTVTSNPAHPSYVPLRPSRQATRVTEAGAVTLNLRWTTGAAASWSLVVLTCSRDGLSLSFSGQADANGDVIVPLTGLPPLAASQNPDRMTMTVFADFSQAGSAIGDPDALKPAMFSTAGAAAAATQSFTAPRGAVSTAASLKISPIVLSH
jgi:hypothetical protein